MFDADFLGLVLLKAFPITTFPITTSFMGRCAWKSNCQVPRYWHQMHP